MKRKRARKIRGGGRKRISKFPSLKKGESVHCESTLERDFCYLAEIDPNVLYFCEQPFSVKYYLNCREHYYTPDFYLKRKDGEVIVEVKPAEKASSPEWKELFNIVSPILEDAGYRFIVVTETDIRQEPRLTNIKILSRYWRIMLSVRNQADAQSFLRDGKRVMFKSVQQCFSKKGTPVEVVYALIYWGVLSIDIMKPLNGSSIVSLSSESSLPAKCRKKDEAI